MSRANFERVKLSVTHEIPADAIVRELGLPLAEVNRAILAGDFEEYKNF